MDISLENWNTHNIITHQMRYKKNGGVAPGSGKTQCSSIQQNQNREVGRGGWENRGRERAYGPFREWGSRKGEII